MDAFESLLDQRISIPVSAIAIVGVAMLLAALAEIAGHYYFHPNIRRPLGKIGAYTYGSLAWAFPL